MLLNNKWSAEEIEKEIKKICEDKWKWKHNDPKPLGCSKSSSKREVYSSTILPQETRKTSHRQPNCSPKTPGKRTKTKQKTKLAEGKKS